MEAVPAMKRKANRDPACEEASLDSSPAVAAKKRRGGQLAPKEKCKALPAPQVAKRPRGRPPSKETLKKREAKQIADAIEAAEAFALELARLNCLPSSCSAPCIPVGISAEITH